MSKADDMVYAYKTSPALRQEIDKAMQIAGEHIYISTINGVVMYSTPNTLLVLRSWFRHKVKGWGDGKSL